MSRSLSDVASPCGWAVSFSNHLVTPFSTASSTRQDGRPSWHSDGIDSLAETSAAAERADTITSGVDRLLNDMIACVSAYRREQEGCWREGRGVCLAGPRLSRLKGVCRCAVTAVGGQASTVGSVQLSDGWVECRVLVSMRAASVSARGRKGDVEAVPSNKTAPGSGQRGIRAREAGGGDRGRLWVRNGQCDRNGRERA